MSIDTLQEKIRALKNPSMVGLDPTPEVVPGYLLEEARQELGATPEAAAAAYRRFCRELMDGLQGLVPAVKVQSACFHALGSAGVAAMQEVLRDARDRGYYVLLDLMRGDVTGTAQLCAASVFGTVEAAGPGYRPYPCDAVTLHGYLGSDSVKTSNRSSVEVQDLLTGGRLVHTAMADLVSRWGSDLYGKCGYSQVAAVVSASYPQVLKSLRAKYDRMFFLVPGYGVQGGTAKNVQYAFDRFGHGAVVCASRSILGAWRQGESQGEDYVNLAVQAAEKMKKDLGKYTVIM